MQFKHILLIATAAVLSTANPVPDSSLSCSDPKHPCKTYNSFPDCSKEYVDTLTQYVPPPPLSDSSRAPLTFQMRILGLRQLGDRSTRALRVR